jgi:hypothetical protein
MRAIGKADRKRVVLFQNGPSIRKAKIAARADNEIRLLMPLQGAPTVKLAVEISIWLPVIVVGIPNT